jgi:hypothetical protein
MTSGLVAPTGGGASLKASAKIALMDDSLQFYYSYHMRRFLRVSILKSKKLRLPQVEFFQPVRCLPASSAFTVITTSRPGTGREKDPA